MTDKPRAVFDTNVFVSASLSKNSNSPTRELLQRWKNDEFTLVICDQIAIELVEKLAERGIGPDSINEQITALARATECVQ